MYRFDDGTTYIGNWVHGKKHGQGRLEMASGEVYDGEWKDDKKCMDMSSSVSRWVLKVSTLTVSGGYGNYVGSNGKYTTAVTRQTNGMGLANGIQTMEDTKANFVR